MGFSFDRAGGAGGQKIRRGPLPAGANTQFNSLRPPLLNSIPQSPSGWLNSWFSMSYQFTGLSAANYTRANGSSILSTTMNLSFGSTYWVDLLAVMGIVYDPQTVNLSVNGNSAEVPYMVLASSFRAPYGVAVFDVYGYGLSATLNITQTASTWLYVNMGMLAPNTVVGTDGYVIWPPGMSTFQAVRAI